MYLILSIVLFVAAIFSNQDADSMIKLIFLSGIFGVADAITSVASSIRNFNKNKDDKNMPNEHTDKNDDSRK